MRSRAAVTRRQFVRSAALLAPAVLLASRVAEAAGLAIVQQASNFGSSATPGVTMGVAPTAGNLLLCMGWCFTYSGVVGSGWTTIDLATSTNLEWEWANFYKVAGASEPTTQNPWTQAVQSWKLTVYEISGQAAGALAINGHSVREVSATSISCTPVTPTVAGCMGFASGIAQGGTGGAHPGAPWVSDGAVDLISLYDHQASLAQSAQAPTYSWTSVTNAVEASLVVVAPSAGGPLVAPWIGG